MKKKIAIMSLCFTALMYLVLTVSVAGLLAAFPDVPESRVMLILTLPNLTGIVGILITPCLTPYLSQKSLSILSLLLLLLGGGICLLLHDVLYALLFASAIMGISYGMVSTLYPMLVNSNFSGNERVTVMGLCAAMLQGGRLVTYLIGGVLAKRHWYAVYDTYVFAILALLLVAVLLPEDRRSAQSSRQSARDTASFTSGRVWLLSFLAAMFACLYFVISTDGSLYVESYGLGTASTTGVLSSLSCAVAGVFAALYGRISRITGRFNFAIAFVILGIGYTFAGCRVSTLSITVAFVASALGIALYTPWLMTAISDAANSADAPVATAIVLTCLNIGYFASPYFTAPVGRCFGNGPAFSFLAAGITSLLFAALTAFLCRKKPLV